MCGSRGSITKSWTCRRNIQYKQGSSASQCSDNNHHFLIINITWKLTHWYYFTYFNSSFFYVLHELEMIFPSTFFLTFSEMFTSHLHMNDHHANVQSQQHSSGGTRTNDLLITLTTALPPPFSLIIVLQKNPDRYHTNRANLNLTAIMTPTWSKETSVAPLVTVIVWMLFVMLSLVMDNKGQWE